MEPAEALAELKEISAQVRHAVIIDADGKQTASTIEDESRAAELAEAAARLVEAVNELAAAEGKPVSQVEAALEDGSVAVVREGIHTIVATTAPEPTIGLVLYDLRTCLRATAEVKPERKRAPRKKKETDAAA